MDGEFPLSAATAAITCDYFFLKFNGEGYYSSIMLAECNGGILSVELCRVRSKLCLFGIWGIC